MQACVDNLVVQFGTFIEFNCFIDVRSTFGGQKGTVAVLLKHLRFVVLFVLMLQSLRSLVYFVPLTFPTFTILLEHGLQTVFNLVISRKSVFFIASIFMISFLSREFLLDFILKVVVESQAGRPGSFEHPRGRLFISMLPVLFGFQLLGRVDNGAHEFEVGVLDTQHLD